MWALASGLPYRSPGVSGLRGQWRLGLRTLPPAFHPAGGEVILTGQESSGGPGMHGALGGVWCLALSGPHAAPEQARQFPRSRAGKAWVGSEGGGAMVGWTVGVGEVSSRAPERHPGGCSGLQSAESEGGRVLESPGAALWHPQQNLHKEGGPCAHLWGQKRRWWLKRVVVSLRNPPESLGRRGDPPPPPAPGTVLQQI